MKPIKILHDDLQKLSQKGKIERKIDIRIIYKNWKKSAQEQSDLQKEKVKQFLSHFDFFDRLQFFQYITLVLGVGVTLFFSIPALSTVYKLQQSIVTTNMNADVMEQDFESLKGIDEKLAVIRNDIVRMNRSVPEKAFEEDMILILGSLVAKNKLVSPNRFVWTKEKETVVNNPDIAENYDIYSYTFGTQGSFEDVQNLLKDLQKNLRIIDVKSIKMVPLAGNVGVDISVSVWAYNKKDLI